MAINGPDNELENELEYEYSEKIDLPDSEDNEDDKYNVDSKKTNTDFDYTYDNEKYESLRVDLDEATRLLTNLDLKEYKHQINPPAKTITIYDFEAKKTRPIVEKVEIRKIEKEMDVFVKSIKPKSEGNQAEKEYEWSEVQKELTKKRSPDTNNLVLGWNKVKPPFPISSGGKLTKEEQDVREQEQKPARSFYKNHNQRNLRKQLNELSKQLLNEFIDVGIQPFPDNQLGYMAYGKKQMGYMPTQCKKYLDYKEGVNEAKQFLNKEFKNRAKYQKHTVEHMDRLRDHEEKRDVHFTEEQNKRKNRK